MIFNIDFNYTTTEGDKILERLGMSIGKHEYYTKEISSLEELESLQKEVCKIMNNEDYSLVVDFNGFPTIFFDNKC